MRARLTRPRSCGSRGEREQDHNLARLNARWRRSVPPGFIRPCEPALVAYPPAGPGWLHEIKHDGFRILARKQDERVRIWSRRGADFADRFQRIDGAVRGVNVDEATRG